MGFPAISPTAFSYPRAMGLVQRQRTTLSHSVRFGQQEELPNTQAPPHEDPGIVDAYNEAEDKNRGWLTRFLLRRIANYQRGHRVRVKDGKIRYRKNSLISKIPFKLKGLKPVLKKEEDYWAERPVNFPDGKVISWKRGDCCGFYPSCSTYGADAIRKYGPLKGILKTFVRVFIKCNPMSYSHLYHQEGTQFVAEGYDKGKIFDPP